MQPLIETYIALVVGYIDERAALDAVERYAKDQIHGSETLDDVLWLNRKRRDDLERVEPCLRAYIEESWPDVQLDGSESEEVARACFERRLREYLDERSTPREFCRMVQPVEELFDYPIWLGDMYNLCDWIEPTTMPVDCRHLETGIREMLGDV